MQAVPSEFLAIDRKERANRAFFDLHRGGGRGGAAPRTGGGAKGGGAKGGRGR